MLTGLDECLLHQIAQPIALAGTSDHRFFDRIIIGCFHSNGVAAFIVGIGVYKNMNVIDGFVIAQCHSNKQYNVRFSKALRPITDINGSEIGPLKLEVIKPLEIVRVTLAKGDYPVALDMEFSHVLPVRLEDAHTGRLDGRLHTDYLRYHQLGKAKGWLEIKGERFEIDDWFAWRDHSWGTRPNVGGFEPDTGTKTGRGLPSAIRSGSGSIMVCHVGFWNGQEGGGIQFIEDGEGKRLYSDGVAGRRGDPAGELSVTSITHNVKFYPGGKRVVEKMHLDLVLNDGAMWKVELNTVGRPFVYRGGGYDRGYFDGKGHGVFRSNELLIEQDVYDVTNIEDVVLEDGSLATTVHREQFATAVVNGVPGFAYTPCIMIGPHPRYGIGVSE